MANWMAALVSLVLLWSLALLLRWKKRLLPPGPPAFPVLGNLIWLTRPVSDVGFVVRELRARYGPLFTLRVGSHPIVMVTDRELAHKLLVQHGVVFANRPAPFAAISLLSSYQLNINTTGYGPLWRLLRRNLMSEILHPSRIKIYAHGRQWALGILLTKLRTSAESGDGTVVVMESFQFAAFCLLVLMCFGEKLDEKAIRDIEKAQRDLLLFLSKVNVAFAFLPGIAKDMFRNRWRRLLDLRRRLRDILVPLIRAHREQTMAGRGRTENSFQFSYVDSLLDLDLPEENRRKLDEEEIISLCSEFLTAGTDTTSTALQWIMANVVKHQSVQEKIVDEINGVLTEGEEIREKDLHKFTYLKAVIMEGLRRHPPGHFVLPHAVTEEFSVNGYVIPKDATVNFTVADINWDARVWDEPMEFRPERFLSGGEGEGVDITGSREVKMMPFGVGMRICPAVRLAMLHLEYFVANLVREFEWKAVDGEEVDLTETWEFSTVMKIPLRAQITPRRRTTYDAEHLNY